MQEALAMPDVWVLTISQLVDWMEAPVAAKDMDKFMLRYACKPPQ